jgi:hypothetical protein
MADFPISPVVRRVVYTGSAGTGPYAFTFEILAQTDIDVYVDSTLKTLTTDYTVSINANGTGSVNFVTAPGSTKQDHNRRCQGHYPRIRLRNWWRLYCGIAQR